MSEKKKEKDNELKLERKIVQIVHEHIMQFDGVSKLVGGFTANITDTILGRESSVPGIWIDKNGDQYIIGIRINVKYGVNIPQLSYDIQTDLKNALTEPNVSIKSINISVVGIDRVGDK